MSQWTRLRSERSLALVETPDGYAILDLLEQDNHFARISDRFEILAKARKENPYAREDAYARDRLLQWLGFHRDNLSAEAVRYIQTHLPGGTE